jgi:hypothetical protein
MAGDREAELRAAIRDDADRLVAIVIERWTPVPDPLGEPMLLPKADDDDDPVRLDDFDWAEVRGMFRERFGRVPQSGSRQVAGAMLLQRAGRGSQ